MSNYPARTTERVSRNAANVSTTPRRKLFRAHDRSAFTLMETALAIVIVGTGVISIMQAQMAFHQQNSWSSHTSAATFLANEIREMTVRLPRHDPVTGTAFWGPEPNESSVVDFDDLDDFDGDFGVGVVFSDEAGNGPINAMREEIPDMAGWAQVVRCYNVDPMDMGAVGDDGMDGTTNMIRMEVTVTYQGPNDADPTEITQLVWISKY